MSKCLYCGEETKDPHFQSDCCGRGMCDNCYNALQGTDEQLQVSDTSENIKEEYKDATYLCFECADIWQERN